jgi:hypothetical protein
MQKKLIYIAFFVILLASCEEYYNPAIKRVSEKMVVESNITNDPNQNYVKLTKALDFYSSDQAEKIEGAKVELIESNGSSLTGIESSTGYFTFSNTPIPGKKYYLRINWGNDIYESEMVVMPPLPTIDTLYTKHIISESYRNNIYGPPVLVETPGREICIDAIVTPQLEYYRFDWRAVLQWFCKPYYGWKSKYDKGIFNIAGSKDFSPSAKITQHPVGFLEYDTRAFLDSDSQTPLGWIVIIDQYGIQKESYDFHEKLNKQLSAEGSLFDPILTQVYGNIHCITDQSKIVAGFFDLNSYCQYRYFLRIGMRINVENYAIQRRINRYPDIPYYGYLKGIRPQFWEDY